VRVRCLVWQNVGRISNVCVDLGVYVIALKGLH
jgi:hypothetical protein